MDHERDWQSPLGQRWAQVTLWTLGALWAARSLQSFSNPNFYSPGSVADWFAVASVSIALGLLPVGVWILLQRSNLEPLPVRSLSLAAMVTAGTAAVANVVEDGFGVSGQERPSSPVLSGRSSCYWWPRPGSLYAVLAFLLLYPLPR